MKFFILLTSLLLNNQLFAQIVRLDNGDILYKYIVGNEKTGVALINQRLGKMQPLIKPEKRGITILKNGNIILMKAVNDNLYSLMDYKEKIIVPPTYSEIELFASKAYFGAKVNGKWGVYDMNGNTILKNDYDSLNSMIQTLYVVIKRNGKTGLIDQEGKIIIQPQYESLSPDFSDGLLVTQLKGKWGHIDINNKIIIPHKYEDAENFREGLATIKLNGKYGVIDKNQNVVIPIIYDGYWDRIGEFNYGLATYITRKNNETVAGFLNSKGKLAIPLNYDYCYAFEEGLAMVEKKDKIGFINMNNEIIIPLMYDAVETQIAGISSSTHILNDRIRVEIDGKYGYINKKGTPVIPIIYDDLTDFETGVAIAGKNGMKLLIDINGKIISQEYMSIATIFNDTNCVVGVRNGKFYIIDKKNKAETEIKVVDKIGN